MIRKHTKNSIGLKVFGRALAFALGVLAGISMNLNSAVKEAAKK